MEIHLKIVGILLLILALIHIAFPKYFEWKKGLSGLSLINKQMMLAHTFFIALTVFMMGLLCLCCTSELLETNIGHKILFGLGVFWAIRLYFQFFFYSKDLWKGQKFETYMHILFAFFWVYISFVFFFSATQSWF